MRAFSDDDFHPSISCGANVRIVVVALVAALRSDSLGMCACVRACVELGVERRL